MSSHKDCKSLYGRTKFEIEKKLLLHDDVLIIRPGLLYDYDFNLGLFSKMLQLAIKLPILPLIDNGSQPQYTTHTEDISSFLLDVINNNDPLELSNIYFVGDPSDLSLKKLLEIGANKKITSIKIPWQVAWYSLKVLELIGVKSSFRSDSVLGLRDAVKINSSLIINKTDFTYHNAYDINKYINKK